MSEKKELAKEIRILEEEIKLLEGKRARSQAALLEALISHTEPEASEVQFFRTFTAEIETKRDRMNKLVQKLEQMI